MAEVPQNTAEQQARGRIYERVRDAYARLEACGTGGFVVKDGPVEVIAMPYRSVFSGLMSPRYPAKDVEACLRRAMQLYRPSGNSLWVSLGPSSGPTGLRELLKAHGFRCSYHVPFLHLDFATWRPAAARIPGVKMVRLTDYGVFVCQPHPWIGALTTPARRAKFEFTRGLGEAAKPRWWEFAASVGGELAGTAAVFRAGDAVGVFNVGVRPSHRRRGIGTALLVTACRFAQEQGAACAVLSASSMGLGLYRRVGFADAGRYSDFWMSRGRLAQVVAGFDRAPRRG